MRKLYHHIRFVVFLLMLSGFTACDFVEIDEPTDKIITSNLYEDEATATAAVLGLYSRLVQTGQVFSNGGITVFAGLASDELYVTNPALVSDMQFQNNQIAVGNGTIYNYFWRRAYEIIYQANACLEGLQDAPNIGEETKKQLMGECYFIRAFCYWYLVNLFGEVPLALTTDHEVNRQLSRTAIDLVKEQILADLTEARNRLPAEYPTEGKVRINYYTVIALLSRYYLYEENWTEVENLTTEIIQSPLYAFEEDIDKVFLIESQESIWQMESSASVINSNEGNIFIPAFFLPMAKPSYSLTNTLLADFENDDLRKASWIAHKEILDIKYPYPFKYKIQLNSTKTENLVMFRMGEVYLNRAEARAHLDKRQEALDDLNILRSRANLPEKTLADTPDVLTDVLKERRIELFAEWGHRWFDLKRTGQIDEVLNIAKSHWESTDALFPIPDNEIIANPNLEQNPGYNN